MDNKQIMLHPYNGILYSNKKAQISATHKGAESQMHHVKWKKLGSMGYLILVVWNNLYDSLEKAKTNMDENKISGCHRLGWGRKNDYQRDLDMGVLELSYILIVGMVRQPYTFVKTHRTIHYKE